MDTCVPAVMEEQRVAQAACADFMRLGRPRVNLLLMGPQQLIEAAVDALTPSLLGPTKGWHPGEPLVLPSAATVGTLILHNIDALAEHDQRRLFAWLDDAAGSFQIVSTTPIPLLPRIESGEFIERLYYRLNTVCLDLT